MKQTETKIKYSLSEFQRYIRGEMTKGEENSFQMKLQDRPFNQAIIEGCFSGFSLREAAQGLDSRNQPLRRNDKGSGKRLSVYILTTVVAMLLIVYAGYIILENNIPVWLQSGSFFTPGPPEARGLSQTTGNYPAQSILGTDSIETVNEQDLLAMSADTNSLSGIEKPDSTNISGVTSKIELQDSGQLITGDKKSETDSGLGMQTGLKPDSVSLSEGNDTSKNSGNDRSVHLSPQPVDGTISFRNYIESNIKDPDPLSHVNEVVAVISFLVRVTGEINSIKVISSPGEKYSQEAIRLIKEGPAWKPAEENGKAIEEEVTLRIVFK